MNGAPRFAIFAAPRPDSPLARFGAGLFGWDAEAGAEVARLSVAGYRPDELVAATAAARRYGFHGTLKPPFRLIEGHGADDLETALRAFAAGRPPVRLEGLAIREISNFVALMPTGALGALNALATAAVSELDAFRAPAPAAETARRERAGLSANQQAMLARWGYPFVLDEFRFHLTLGGPFSPAERRRYRDALAPLVEPFATAPCAIADLCLFADPADGTPMRIRARAPLGGDVTR